MASYRRRCDVDAASSQVPAGFVVLRFLVSTENVVVVVVVVLLFCVHGKQLGHVGTVS